MQHQQKAPHYLKDCYFEPLYAPQKQGLVDYLENSGMAALKESRDVYLRIYEDARKTLTFLLAGVGVSFGYLFKLISDAGTMQRPAWCIAVACAWLCLCTFILLKKCVNSRRVPIIHTPPEDLYTPAGKDVDIDLTALRLVHLEGLQVKIAAHDQVNRHVVRWLDRVRNLTALTPLVALLPYVPLLLRFTSS